VRCCPCLFVFDYKHNAKVGNVMPTSLLPLLKVRCCPCLFVFDYKHYAKVGNVMPTLSWMKHNKASNMM